MRKNIFCKYLCNRFKDLRMENYLFHKLHSIISFSRNNSIKYDVSQASLLKYDLYNFHKLLLGFEEKMFLYFTKTTNSFPTAYDLICIRLPANDNNNNAFSIFTVSFLFVATHTYNLIRIYVLVVAIVPYCLMSSIIVSQRNQHNYSHGLYKNRNRPLRSFLETRFKYSNQIIFPTIDRHSKDSALVINSSLWYLCEVNLTLIILNLEQKRILSLLSLFFIGI